MTITIGETTTYVGELVTMVCSNERCGVVYALSDNYVAARRRDHETFYCPNGHARHYPGESDIEKAQRLRRLALSRERDAWAALSATRDQLRASERSKAALRGHLTRARNKIANGVCPVGNCRRHFDNVQAHIATEHPTWSLTDPETGKAAKL